MNPSYVARALCYHGQPLQKIWDDERGVDDLREMRITQPSYSIYLERQKYFTFQERAKRLKIHQFLARKAQDLYDKQLVGGKVNVDADLVNKGMEHIANIPPYECFLTNIKDKTKDWHHLLTGLAPGDIIYGKVSKVFLSANRLFVKPLCTAEPLIRYLAVIPIKAEVPAEYMGILPNTKTPQRIYTDFDYVRCEIIEVSSDAERLTLGFTGLYTKSKLSLGLIDKQDFPKYYRKMEENAGLNYEEMLKNSPEFENPNYDMLYELNGLNINDHFTLMCGLKNGFPSAEYANELRQTQASKWAFHYVAEGIEHFKNGQQIEAFQCLNKALTIDPSNVEGLVARGALYANKGSFLKAIEDFEKALKLNSYHVNARKYMGETLVALGHNYEEENRLQDAIKAYNDCLLLIPNHEQARISLDALQRPNNTNNNPSSSMVCGASGGNYDEFMQFPNNNGNNNNHGTADSTTSDTDDGDTSGNDSESSTGNARNSTVEAEPYGKPYYAGSHEKQPPDAMTNIKNANEFNLEDDETVSQVRKLLREANKHKKSKKKSDKKKGKKSRKDKDYAARSQSLDGHSSGVAPTTADIEYLQKLDFDQAYRIMQLNTQQQLHENNPYAQQQHRERSETPPPAPPSMKLPTNTYVGNDATHMLMDMSGPSTSRQAAEATSGRRIPSPIPPAPSMLHQRESDDDDNDDAQQQKFSFQIKRPIKVDKFGLVRLATPLSHRNSGNYHSNRSSYSRSRSRSRSRSHHGYSRDLASTRRGYSPSPSRSRSRSRWRRSRSYSPRYRRRGRTSPSTHRRGGRQRSPPRRRTPPRERTGRPRRRTPSPFVPRGTPSPRTRYRRTRSPAECETSATSSSRHNRTHRASRSPRNARSSRAVSDQRRTYGNRVWNRITTEDTRRHERECERRTKSREKQSCVTKTVDPTIEEIDEIINKAQKERKQEIIKRDKDIVKKKESSNTG